LYCLDDTTWNVLLGKAANFKPKAALTILDQWMPKYQATKTYYQYSLLLDNPKIPGTERRRLKKEVVDLGLDSQKAASSKAADLKNASTFSDMVKICRQLALEGNTTQIWAVALRTTGFFRGTREMFQTIVSLMQSAGAVRKR